MNKFLILYRQHPEGDWTCYTTRNSKPSAEIAARSFKDCYGPNHEVAVAEIQSVIPIEPAHG